MKKYFKENKNLKEKITNINHFKRNFKIVFKEIFKFLFEVTIN